MFLPEFLFVALAKDALSLLVGRLDIFVGVILGNCHKADTLWQTVEYLMQMTLNVVVHDYCSYSGLSSFFVFAYSKTSISVVSATEAMT